jgi:hypothetical protein
MSIKKNFFDSRKAQKEIKSLINDFFNLADSFDLRHKVLKLIPAFLLLRQIGKSIISPDLKLAARDRILTYLQKYPLIVIDSEELMVISGITDYQRRIRELRVQLGWPILSGSTVRNMYSEGEWPAQEINASKMKADEYIFLNSGQDRDAAHRWNLINTIRNEKTSVKDKIIKYLVQNIGKEVTGEELSYLAKAKKEWARRIRELRTEDGWPVKTRISGRPDLPVGVYVLEENRQAEIHDRKIEDSVRINVLERDNFSCRKCGWNQKIKKEGDPRHLLELHHLN